MTELLKLSTRAMSEADFRAERYRKHREAWVLGHFAVIYNAMPGCLRRLEFAEAGDSTSIPADFAVYDAQGMLVTDAEIAELTDVWDWWNPGTEIPAVENPWHHISRLLRQKGRKAKRYRSPTWLIVYDNVSSGIFLELDGISFGASIAAVEAALAWPSFSSVFEIWVVSSDGRTASRVWRQPHDEMRDARTLPAE